MVSWNPRFSLEKNLVMKILGQPYPVSPSLLPLFQSGCKAHHPHLFFEGLEITSQKGKSCLFLITLLLFSLTSNSVQGLLHISESHSATSLTISAIQSQPYAIHWLGNKNTFKSQPREEKKKKKAVGVQANPAGASAIESWLRAVSISDF